MTPSPPSPGPFPHKEGRGAKESEIVEKSPSLILGEGFGVGAKTPSLILGRVDTNRRSRTGGGVLLLPRVAAGR